ncbi:fatty acid synthase beta subunit [Penicillium argentinense]|uniref:Fatty acid synthase beta subunit n=1 Tax=Penicillium argentinense TaxID=1131581 RepID=A0A9W9FDU9_9EURO|nr:fatty acid synthase beta subunit [Penicillium argentinense]KAJ5098403.1 fatty acid synthase beta subunit [Penicillium argentinense]
MTVLRPASIRLFFLNPSGLSSSHMGPSNSLSSFLLRFILMPLHCLEELAQDGEPSSVTELVALYIGHVAREVEEGDDDAQGSCLEVLKLDLNEFERAFVHATMSTLWQRLFPESSLRRPRY